MKKFYSMLCVALMSLAALSLSAADDVTLTVKVNDPANIEVKPWYIPNGTGLDPVTFDDNNECVVEFMQTSQRYIYATPKNGMYITGIDLRDSEGDSMPNYPKTTKSKSLQAIVIPANADGGTLEITVGTLEDDGKLNFTVNGDPAKVSLYIDGRKIDNIVAGDQTIKYKTATEKTAYIIPSGVKTFYKVTVDGAEIAPYLQGGEGGGTAYAYQTYLTNNMSVVVDVDYPEVKFPVTITCNEPAFIKSVLDDEVAVEGETSNLEILAGHLFAVVGDSYNYTVNSLTVNGVEKYTSSSYSEIVTGPISVVFDVTYIERPYSAIFFSDLKGGDIALYGNTGSQPLMAEGYNTLRFNDAENPFVVQKFASIPDENRESELYVYLNDQPVVGEWGTFEFVVATDDVVKAIMDFEEPSFYDVTYTCDGINPIIIRDKVVAVDVEAGQRSLPGTLVSITAPEGAQITSVKVNDEELSPVEGTYEFTVEGNTAVTIVGKSSGIDRVDVNAIDPNAHIYNLNGVRVDMPASQVPSGIYVIDGKKVRINR